MTLSTCAWTQATTTNLPRGLATITTPPKLIRRLGDQKKTRVQGFGLAKTTIVVLRADRRYYFPTRNEKSLDNVGDIDNLMKLTLDAIQGIMYYNDGVVKAGKIKKFTTNQKGGYSVIRLRKVFRK